MLSNANLWHRHDFWAKIVSTAPYLVNWSPHSIDFKILEEAWPGDPIEYSIMWEYLDVYLMYMLTMES